MMLKWMVLIALGLLVYWFMKRTRQIEQKGNEGSAMIEDMVCCSHCGVHLPKSESIADRGRYFCNAHHLQQYRDSEKRNR